MRRIYAVGEDEVTKAIIRKVLSVFAPDLELFEELPARGSQVKNLINNFNKLAASDPVILLTDLDEVDCAPMAKYRLLNGQEQQEDFIINIAVDEAEAWLVADSANFADYFGIDLQDMPGFVMQRQGGNKECMEISLPIKTSYYLTHTLILKSGKRELREQLASHGRRSKGKEYNIAIVPFVERNWDIRNAMANSDSLRRMIKRVEALNLKYKVSG